MTDWIGTNRRSLAIIRISSRRQEGNISQDVQEREIRDYCAQNGLSLESIHKFTESGKDSDDRKKYAAAIAAALTQDIRHVLFYMYDREARNLTDNEKNEKLVRAGLLVLHYVRDHKVLHQDSSDSDYFIRDVQAVTSKQFIRNLTAKVNDAMKQKADTGWYPSNQLPLGYALQKLKDERGRELKRGAIVVRDPDEKRVRQVIREFELRAQGLTFNEIKSQIISEGFIPKGKVNQYRPNVIEARISNRFYEGVFLWKGVTYTGKHERIVPDSLIQAARAVGRGRKLRHRDPEGHGIFAGGAWFKCVCGCAIIYEPVRKIYRSGNVQTFHYYRCTNGKRAHQRKQYIREQLIWDQFTLAVESIQISDELAAKIAEALNATHRSVVTASNRKALELKRKIAELEKEEEQIGRAHV